MPPKSVVSVDEEVMGGTPVFVGTRVPVQSLFDHLEGGDTVDGFLRQFPSVGDQSNLDIRAPNIDPPEIFFHPYTT